MEPTPAGPHPGHRPVPPRPTRPVTDSDLPFALRVAASWSWRIAIVLVVGWAVAWGLAQLSFLVIPVLVAALLAGLLNPVVAWLRRARVPKGLAVAVTELGFIAVVAGLLTLVGRQISSGFAQLWGEALQGLAEVQKWLAEGPLQLTSSQLETYIKDAQNLLETNQSTLLNGVLSVSSSAGHFITGALIALFVLVFFLLEGERIWTFLVGLLPRQARPAADGAGRRGWTSLVSYVRVQVFVAAVDAVGIGVGAAVLGVPLALPLGILVFVASFVPVVGALLSGAVAVLLALVANGLVNALIMLIIVVAVQQLESHVLQPLVMGRAVALHPVAVILAVAAGSYIAGIAGALFAVPTLAVTNSAVRYIAARSWENSWETGRAPAQPDEAGLAPESPEAL
ncbi:AI-2E family transporter [Sinomonas cellulolyticus]|uniref:AI-2E family transporter n=1 Tax=Sinomonas cellulolyticus TaxID=2801916 RepID=A0ABS1JYI3_9MICC|nr:MULTISPECIES: AI-2E family transporter [Sinomonas]MBL0704459.1 AI-2E family transporter [Sinomonas cellulolyticus]GHG48793.1 AI-2E family transporter [Sinomonas sp. KCTC 49339]